jgi:DNA (cytosine-5)-methyltransferase 1
MSKQRLRAIDLYSGVGGWSLGLRLAGIEVVASYERWGAANETNFKNNQHQAQTVDIRRLSIGDLPSNIDVVVGSPPCTQFSFSNRGGGGDISDGLEDIVRFLTIVDHLKPRAWVMENVPRVAGILEEELRPKGKLAKFRHLGMAARVFNLEDFGLPQRRRRCLAGNIDFDRLASYSERVSRHTLGDVVKSLGTNPVVDPIYNITVDRSNLLDHTVEAHLNEEEVRINRAAKTLHPVYNHMVFPDSLKRSVRTITATCTRVSRESIVIEDPAKKGAYRRLTIRERASLQGFPVTFQFYGDSYSQKQKMVGNALPPVFAYFVAQAIRGKVASKVPAISKPAKRLILPSPAPKETHPDRPSTRFPATRTFRFAIPSLRLKSGVRFEFSNVTEACSGWAVKFYFGSSKAIESVELDATLYRRLLKQIPSKLESKLHRSLEGLATFVSAADVTNMQALWSHRGPGRTRAFMFLDELDQAGQHLAELLADHEDIAQILVTSGISSAYPKSLDEVVGVAKLNRNAALIAAGLLIGSLTNSKLTGHKKITGSAKARRAAVVAIR